MKSVLISIKPKWCEKIARGEKTIEVSKTVPKCDVPFKCYIYETKAPEKLYGVIKDGDEFYGVIHRGKPIFVKCRENSWISFLRENEQKVIGEFICDKVIRSCGWRLRGDTQQCAKRTIEEEMLPKLACLTIDEIVEYAGSENREVCGWHISDLKIYDKPRELNEFGRFGAPMKRPCAPWCYVEELEK